MPSLPPGAIERIDVFLDQEDRPRAVLDAVPYRLVLDTREIAEGPHQLHLVTAFRGGGESTRTLNLTIRNRPPLLSDGIDDGDLVSGVIDAKLQLAPETVGGARGAGRWVAAAVVVSALVGFWCVIAFVPARLSKAGRSAGARASTEEPIDQSLWREGSALYGQNCAGCHQENGEGVPQAFPPLAHNSSLSNVDHVIKVIVSGVSGPLTVRGQSYHGQMPPQLQLTDEQVAAIATYVRNHFGNHLGGVSKADVTAARQR